jgi:hypothetical protein
MSATDRAARLEFYESRAVALEAVGLGQGGESAP